MERKSFADMDCSVAQCLEVIGEWWSMLVVRDAFLGVTRFDDFQRRLGISRNILQQRLTGLVDSGVLTRVPYSEHPPRFEYRLTQAGLDLYPVIVALMQWGDRYLTNGDAPPMVLTHHCGEVLGAVTTCSSCGEPVLARDVRPTLRRATTNDDIAS